MPILARITTKLNNVFHLSNTLQGIAKKRLINHLTMEHCPFRLIALHIQLRSARGRG